MTCQRWDAIPLGPATLDGLQPLLERSKTRPVAVNLTIRDLLNTRARLVPILSLHMSRIRALSLFFDEHSWCSTMQAALGTPSRVLESLELRTSLRTTTSSVECLTIGCSAPLDDTTSRKVVRSTSFTIRVV